MVHRYVQLAVSAFGVLLAGALCLTRRRLHCKSLALCTVTELMYVIYLSFCLRSFPILVAALFCLSRARCLYISFSSALISFHFPEASSTRPAQCTLTPCSFNFCDSSWTNRWNGLIILFNLEASRQYVLNFLCSSWSNLRRACTEKAILSVLR